MKSFRDPVDEWLKETVGNAANPMITMLGKLTDQQYEFARAYVLSASHKKAGERAKMPKGTNTALLVHLPKIAACINILTAKREEMLGKKSSAEIMERIQNTTVFEADDFGMSEASVAEREGLLGKPRQVTEELKGLEDSSLVENLINGAGAANGIMQLPKVKVPTADHFGHAWVIERLVTVAERCLQIEPVFDTKGRPIGTFTFNPNGALKAMEMLGKTMAMFKEKIEVTGELSSFKSEELDDRIKALVKQHPSLAKIVQVEEVAA